MQTSAHTSPCLSVKQDNSWLLWLHTFYFMILNYSMILNLSLLLFQARESEMASWNTLQICANLRPPHASAVAICPVSFTIICFYASPSISQPPAPQSETTSAYRRTDRHLLHVVHFDHGGCNWLCTIDSHDSWNVSCPLPYPSSPTS